MSKGFCTHIKMEGVRSLGNNLMGELIHYILINGRRENNNSGEQLCEAAVILKANWKTQCFPNDHSQMTIPKSSI